MNNIKNRLLLSCVAIGFSSVALLANAQEKPWTGCKDQVNKEECRHANMVKFQAAREAKWHDELKITAAQEPAWKAFADSFHQQGSMSMNMERHEKLSSADAEKVPAPERLEKKLAKMEKHHAAMKTRLAALKTLYAELTPEQQTLLNKRLAEFDQRHHQHRQRGDRKQKKSVTNTDQTPE